jgi:hypothetical protein
MKTYTALSGMIYLLFAFASPCNAILISADLNTTGDGLLTYDERTSLEWLDAPLSLNRSYNDLVGLDGTDEFAIGGDFAGFRLASTGEVKSLFVDTLGIPLTDFAQWVPSSYDKALSLQLLMGTTSGGDFAEIRSITSDVFSDNGIDYHWQSFARICQNNVIAVCQNDINTANVNVNGTLINDTRSSSTTGAWLVRQGVTSVPEPGVLVLLCIGLAGIGVFRKRT